MTGLQVRDLLALAKRGRKDAAQRKELDLRLAFDAYLLIAGRSRDNPTLTEGDSGRAPAEDLPFNVESFDVVVSTLVLFTVDDQPCALREVRRVLRPGGELLFIERVRTASPGAEPVRTRWFAAACAACSLCGPNRSWPKESTERLPTD